MDKITQMNEEIFAENLLKAASELKEKMGIQSTVDKFIIEPVEEEGKMLDGGDEMMKRLVLTKENIGDKKLSVKDVVGVLGGLFPRAPIWINISFIEVEEEIAIFRLDTSLRFRKPTLLRNSESGHAPFKVIC
ncbi:hypothetical protein [Paenilisteria rocourtiae]|uniref:Uncharacterized protein n=1 Tax=Listeria rocourtiae TaxID=647910 RepID=A0A4R6ZEY1_9LIST|nr:hypothetical protein [Listeria rocourtiae]EUJ42295.1 hypothetical protein PROCOU_17470 [Listeria rocourtiae FSL F6-920]MBC1436199.1 hypothetical protein [Listeria rocourtiae]MBC1605862.1 hypothetical protein [Listeria rocourtiae]TDR50680.1 hypothetical protein DFP96_1183 [Listeria rocourtiae]